jgi:hypothetical protein
MVLPQKNVSSHRKPPAPEGKPAAWSSDLVFEDRLWQLLVRDRRELLLVKDRRWQLLVGERRWLLLVRYRR